MIITGTITNTNTNTNGCVLLTSNLIIKKMRKILCWSLTRKSDVAKQNWERDQAEVLHFLQKNKNKLERLNLKRFSTVGSSFLYLAIWKSKLFIFVWPESCFGTLLSHAPRSQVKALPPICIKGGGYSLSLSQAHKHTHTLIYALSLSL